MDDAMRCMLSRMLALAIGLLAVVVSLLFAYYQNQ